MTAITACGTLVERLEIIMSIDLSEKGNGFKDLLEHRGHRIDVVSYGDYEDPDNVAIECESCGEVLLSINAPEDVTESLRHEEKVTLMEAGRLALSNEEILGEMDLSDEAAANLKDKIENIMK